ncbi:phage baseplate assembly protein V [Sphingomonas aracearum]|uniref:Phage baseplate assembly protein V n=1 Tax=Sphingomonas aracearum TaxID=2283317 RepID=A0A369VV12_9SPHN|nr:phage baseplate assembly protein V [Sphingomonas aracearum]RDE05020.1 phage baseplate assembly protein V [Sphingomonas aracearum]
MADPRDIQRLIGDLAREGVVVSVDLAAGTARVQLVGEGEDGEDLLTGDVPWLAPRLGKTSAWSPPSIGEQVLLLCPEADTTRGIILGSLSSDANPHAGNDTSTVLMFGDGAVLRYDPVQHALDAALADGGTAVIEARGGITLKGPLRVEGDVDLQGKLTASDDVVAGGKSLKSHKHTGVQAGGGISGPPQ